MLCQDFWFVVAPTSYLFHLTSAIFRLPSSLSNPKVIRASSLVFFISPVGEKNFSRGGANFYLNCNGKGTKNPDAKQAFLSFISDLFEMLKCKENRYRTPVLAFSRFPVSSTVLPMRKILPYFILL